MALVGPGDPPPMRKVLVGPGDPMQLGEFGPGPAPQNPPVRQAIKRGLEEEESVPVKSVKTESIWDKILTSRFPKEYRDDTKTVLKKLAFLDSIHDFWPERGKKKTTDEDADEAEELNAKDRIEAVHTKLTGTIKRYLQSDKSTIHEILSEQTGKKVTAPTGIEDKVLEYFKKNYAPFNQPEATITVKEILANWKFEKNGWDKYRAAILKLPGNLLIVPDGQYIKSLDTKQLGQLGFFILSYMDPTKNPGDQLVHLTFDMLPRDVGTIFERFTQVRNAIYPQNVADSAPTSFTSLQGRSTFFRANYQPYEKDKTAVVEQVARANTYTNDIYDIAFVDKNFSPKNRLGLSIEVRKKGTTVVLASIPFGKGVEQGPSVNYLMDLLTSLDQKEVKPKLNKVAVFKGSMPTLPPPRLNQDLLFDVKRLGDQEQMLVTTSYGVTGDHFCSAFRRLLRMPGMFHSTKGIRLWRGDGLPGAAAPPQEDEQVIKSRERDFRKKAVIKKLQLVSEIIFKREGVKGQLELMKEEVDRGSQSGTVFSDPIPVAGKLNPDYIAENYTNIACTFATYLLRTRMRDISAQISTIIEAISKVEATPDIKDASCKVDQKQVVPVDGAPCPAPVAPVSPEEIDSSILKLEGFVNTIEALASLSVPIVAKKEGDAVVFTSTPIYTELFLPNGRLKKGAMSELFNFSADSFLNPETGLAPIVGRILSSVTLPKMEVVSEQNNKLLVQYFKARDDIKESFFNEKLKAIVESRTDITSGIDAEGLLTLNPPPPPPSEGEEPAELRQSLVDAIESITERGESRYGVPAVPEPAQGGGQAGGAGSPLQFRDLHDLFARLCLEADHALVIGKDVARALDEIQLTWGMEVNQMRNFSAVEYYGVDFEETFTTDFISYILSFRTGQAGVIPEGIEERDKVRYNDFAKLILTSPKVEQFILQLLATVGQKIIGVTNAVAAQTMDNPEGDKISETYAAPAKWKDSFYDALYVAASNPLKQEAWGLVKGGGLDDDDGTPPNVPATTGSARRRLYEGLRKRSGSGSPPRV